MDQTNGRMRSLYVQGWKCPVRYENKQQWIIGGMSPLYPHLLHLLSQSVFFRTPTINKLLFLEEVGTQKQIKCEFYI